MKSGSFASNSLSECVINLTFFRSVSATIHHSRQTQPPLLSGTTTPSSPESQPQTSQTTSKRLDAMGVDLFSGRGVGLGFGIGCGFGVGWGFGGAPLNMLGIGAGGGCGIGLGLGWGFGAAYGTKYLDSKLKFEGIDFDKVRGEQQHLEDSSSQKLN